MSRPARLFAIAVTAVSVIPALGATAVWPQESPQAQRFDHMRHRGLFPTCAGCHAGAGRVGESIWPNPGQCAVCHDGQVEARVSWAPPRSPAPSNLRFEHVVHAREVAERQARAGAPQPPACTGCHTETGADRMDVQRAAVQQCLACHGIRVAHRAAPDTACATCHVPLAEARSLTVAHIAAFDAPPSHEEPDFGTQGGHGRAAEPTASPVGFPPGISASCATCHARDFCAACHVNAPEQPIIQALAPDPRAIAVVAPGELRVAAPPSHADPGFLARHGARARVSPRDCATCHTKESCSTCHLAAPRAVAALPAAGLGRGPGAALARERPGSHLPAYARRHAEPASAATSSCAGCHTRSQCLDCHRVDAAAAPGGYHPDGFLQRHPAAAWSRESSCSDCHNAGNFCVSCHAQAGLVAHGPLAAGYHDAQRFFAAGHGVAARQSLESCIGCHRETDCLPCHGTSVVGGRGFNPHGPGFDPERLRKKNPQMCTVCHGRAIPPR